MVKHHDRPKPEPSVPTELLGENPGDMVDPMIQSVFEHRDNVLGFGIPADHEIRATVVDNDGKKRTFPAKFLKHVERVESDDSGSGLVHVFFSDKRRKVLTTTAGAFIAGGLALYIAHKKRARN